MKIAFDLDGCLCNIDVAVLRMMDNQPEDVKASVEEWYYRERKPLLDPRLFLSEGDELYIITSRPERLAIITSRWISRYYPKSILRFAYHETMENGVNSKEEVSDWLKHQAKVKADILNDLNLDVYFEDSPVTVKWLREFCPNIKIIHYGGRW